MSNSYGLIILMTVFVILCTAISPVCAEEDSYTVVLLHFNGVDGSNSFTDETGKIWTAGGNAVINTADKKFGSGSGYFDGVNSFITSSSVSDLAFGDEDFTIEAWFKRENLNNFDCFILGFSDSSGTDRSYEFYISTSSIPKLLYWVNGVYSPVGESIAITDTTNWHHIAGVRHNDIITLYIDGNSVGSVTDNRSLDTSSSSLSIGRTGEYTYDHYFQGYIDEVRISKGIARWTENFVPPTGEYSLGSSSSNATASGMVSTSSGSVTTIGGTTEITITLDQVPLGFSGYNVYLDIGNTPIAEVTAVSYPGWAEMNDVSNLPACEDILLKAADLSNGVQSGDTDIELATLTVRGLSSGTTDFVFSSPNFDDEYGNNINISFVSGSFTVIVFNAPVITNITPSESSNLGIVNVSITGLDFTEGGSVVLRNANFTNISGSDFTFVSDSEISCNFNLTCATPGNWSVIVTNSDGQSGTLENGFLVYATVIPIDGQSEMPTDPNSDGLYEDLNGNLDIDYADVNLFFEKLEWMRVNEPVSAFDFLLNGDLSISDITALFNMTS